MLVNNNGTALHCYPSTLTSRRERRNNTNYWDTKISLLDLSSLFNWNTKQLFVYVLATYPSTTASSSNNPSTPNTTVESIIWDTIIPAPESPYSFSALKGRFFPDKFQGANSKSKPKSKKGLSDEKYPGVLRLRNQRSKYQITDITGRIAERENARLVVGWNIQPWIGLLKWSSGSNLEKNVPNGVSGIGFVTSGASGSSQPFNFPPLKTKAETTKKV